MQRHDVIFSKRLQLFYSILFLYSLDKYLEWCYFLFNRFLALSGIEC